MGGGGVDVVVLSNFGIHRFFSTSSLGSSRFPTWRGILESQKTLGMRLASPAAK